MGRHALPRAAGVAALVAAIAVLTLLASYGAAGQTSELAVDEPSETPSSTTIARVLAPSSSAPEPSPSSAPADTTPPEAAAPPAT